MSERIEIVPLDPVYNNYWKCYLNVLIAQGVETKKRYKLCRNDGKLFSRSADLPNEMRVAKGLEPYTYEATDIEIVEVSNDG